MPPDGGGRPAGRESGIRVVDDLCVSEVEEVSHIGGRWRDGSGVHARHRTGSVRDCGTLTGMPSVLGELARRDVCWRPGASVANSVATHRNPWPPRALPDRWAILPGAAVLLAVLTACGSSDFASASQSTTVKPTATATATAKSKAKATATATAATTSTLGNLPPVLSRSPSPVDAAVITSLGDLPTAFGCPKVPEPIVIPASDAGPAAVVCRGTFADEALFLWFAGDPDAKYLAVQAAMAKARFVHAGRGWVAGGMIDEKMGSVGGEVYKNEAAKK